MGVLADIGRSNASSDIKGGLETAVNLKRMGEEAAISRERLGLERERLDLTRESQGSEMALRKEQIANMQMKNQEEAKESERKSVRFPFKGNAFIQNAVGIENESKVIEIAKGHGINISEDGTTSVGDWEKSREQLMADPAVQKLTSDNYKRKIDASTEEVSKLQKKFDTAKEEDRKKAFDDLEKAKGSLESNKAQAMQASAIFAKAQNSKDISENITKLPENIRTKYGAQLDVYKNSGDLDGYKKAVIEIDKLEKGLEASRIAAQSRVDAAKARGKEGMTENQRAIRTEKDKKEVNDNYDKERKSILGKYKLTSEQREFVERGENPANVKGISKENAKKITDELRDAKFRYDARYEKKFGERPAGTKKFSQEGQKMYDEYKATRDKILNAKKKKDGSSISAEERNAALESLDEEARGEGLVE